MIKRIKILISILCIATIAAVNAQAKDVKFELTLNKTRVAIGEVTQAGLSFYGTQSMPAPDLGNVNGLDIRYLGPSTMMTVINGNVSSSITHMYSIVPLKTGKFQLGPFAFKYKGDSYSSNMVVLEVTEEKVAREEKKEEPPAEKLNLDDRIFVTLEMGKLTAYVNELIPVKVKLYVNRLNVSDIQLPTFTQEGFSKVEFREPKQYREQVNGLIYDVLEFKTNIFGTRPGEFTVGPAQIKCNVMAKRKMRKSPMFANDPFDDDYGSNNYMDDFFTRYERYPLELKSDDAKMIVSPLPSEGRPKSFSGAVGDYQFIFSANPVKLKAGDPITLRMDVNGTGNLNTVLMPQLDSTEGFKVYEPQVKTEEHTKTFMQVLIPETDKIAEIPKAIFSYFDPNTREYKTITHGPIPIKVEKGKDEAPSQVIGATPSVQIQMPSADETVTRDIIYIKDAPGRWIRSGSEFYKSKPFGALLAMPMFLLVSLYVFQGRRNRLKSDTRYAGHVAAIRSAKWGLKNLKSQLGDPKAFYETLFKAVQNYFGGKLHMSPAGITYSAVEYALMHKDIDMNILRRLKNIFDACDMARFAMSSIDNDKMRSDLRDFNEIITYFERKRL